MDEIKKGNSIWRNIYEKYLQNISISSCYNSADIACFNQMTLMVVNSKFAKEGIDKEKFEQIQVPLKWLEGLERKIFPTFSNDVVVALGGHKNIVDICAKLLNPVKQSMESILDEYSSKEEKERRGKKTKRETDEPGKTKSYRWGYIKQYVNKLEQISNDHGVPFCNVALIYQIISASRNQPLLFDPDKIIEHFHGKNLCSDLQDKKGSFLQLCGFKNEMHKRLMEIFIEAQLQDLFDPKLFYKHVNLVLDYNKYYCSKGSSLENERKKFLEIYDDVYNLHSEVIWLFVWSNMIDYWIISRLKQGNKDFFSIIEDGEKNNSNTRIGFNNLKQLIASWSPFISESKYIENLDSPSALDDFITRKYFWVNFLSDLNNAPFIRSIISNLEPIKQVIRLDENGLQFVPGYKDQSKKKWNQKVDISFKIDDKPEKIDGIICEIYSMFNSCMFNNINNLKDEPDDNEDNEKEEFDYGNKKKNSEKQKDIKEKITSPSDKINQVKFLIYYTTFRDRAEKYLFNEYSLSCSNIALSTYIISSLQNSVSDHLRKYKDLILKSDVGISQKTGSRYVERHQQEYPHDNSVRYVEDIPMEAISQIQRLEREKMHHRIPGYISQNKLCNLLTEREPFCQKSPKTILRKLQKLIQDGKIDAPMVKDSGKYFKEGNVKDIVDVLMIEIFGYSLTQRAENQ